MAKPPINIPTPDIIDDLLIDNWELRWQVLDIFYQTRVKSSSYNPAVKKIIRQTISMLQGEHDVNLGLIILAVYLLGGYEAIFKVFNELEIANPPEPEKSAALQSLQKKVLNGERGHSFFDYFHFLFKEDLFRESTLTLSLKLFAPDELKKLFWHIPDPRQQAQGFHQLRQQFPQTDLNDMLLADNLLLLKKNPRLIACLQAPLEADIFKQVEALALSNFGKPEFLDATLAACSQLKIHAAVPHISKLVDDKRLRKQAIAALGRLGTEVGMSTFVAASRSIFSGKKIEAAEALGNYNKPEAIECLQKLSNAHNKKLREVALNSLAGSGQPQALTILINMIAKAPEKEKKKLLSAVADHDWPNIPEPLAQKIASLIDEHSSLAPEISQALAAMNHGHLLLPWFKHQPAPLISDQQREICLLLADYAATPAVRNALLPHLQHPNWGFSYQLLCKLHNYFTIEDFPTLLNLLALRESYKPLTIKERLELGKGDDRFVPAMCHYLNQHPQTCNKLLFTINNHLLTRKPPLRIKELEKVLEGHPNGLKQLITEAPFEQHNVSPEELYVLLLFSHYLDEIAVDGCSCFAIIVNQTRKYSGFFTEIIWSIILKILQSERTSTSTTILPYLDQLLATLRGRQGVEELRSMALAIKKRIFSLSRDLVVYSESNRSRELQVFKVKKVNG